jgi:hypothetical protein
VRLPSPLPFLAELTLLSRGRARSNSHFDYISQRASHVYTRRHYSLTSRPEELARKAYLLSYFEDYMAKTLTRDVSWTWNDGSRKRNMDFLVKYYRMKNAIVFKMSNEVLQVGSFLLAFSLSCPRRRADPLSHRQRPPNSSTFTTTPNSSSPTRARSSPSSTKTFSSPPTRFPNSCSKPIDWVTTPRHPSSSMRRG